MKQIVMSAVLILIASTSSMAQDATGLRQKQYNLENNVAIQGYDPVAYFLQSKAVKGSKDLAVYHQGVIYYFSSQANKDAFKKSPDQYEPQYGGWCAYAMGAKGEKVEVDPKTFKIVTGKLYLFYNRFLNNTLTDWNKDESNLKQNADKNWFKLYR